MRTSIHQMAISTVRRTRSRRPVTSPQHHKHAACDLTRQRPRRESASHCLARRKGRRMQRARYHMLRVSVKNRRQRRLLEVLSRCAHLFG